MVFHLLGETTLITSQVPSLLARLVQQLVQESGLKPNDNLQDNGTG